MSTETLGQIAYNAYRATTDGKTWNGYDMPTWEELPPQIRLAWNNAGDAAYRHTIKTVLLEKQAVKGGEA